MSVAYSSVANVRNECKVLFGASPSISATQWREWIDEVVKDICARTFLYGATGTITLTAGTESYAFPTSPTCIHVWAISYNYGTTGEPDVRILQKKSPEEIASISMGAKSVPLYWFPHAQKVFIYPVMGMSPQISTTNVIYAAQHVDLSADDVAIALPDSVLHVIVPGVLYRAHMSPLEGINYEAAGRYKDDYEFKIKQINVDGKYGAPRGVPFGGSEGGDT